MKGHTLPGINQKSDKKTNNDIDEKSGLPDLTGRPTIHDLDAGKNMPVKKSGLGPRTSFGGVKNPELDPKREVEDTAE